MKGKMRPLLAGVDLRIAAVIACVTLTGCGDSNAEDAETPGAAYRSEFNRARCEAAAACCRRPGFSVDACVQNGVPWSDVGSGRSEKYTFHEDLGRQCIEELRHANVCIGAVPEICARVFDGHVPPGERCEGSGECQAPAPGVAPLCWFTADDTRRCRKGANLGEACQQTCDDDGFCWAVPEKGELGSSGCYASSALYCSARGVCEARAGIGEPCLSAAGGALCVSEAGSCQSSTCLALPIGAECLRGGSQCAAGTYCATDQCAPKLPPGSPCERNDVFACIDGFCDDNDVCASSSDVCEAGFDE
jgi:hypothetical protein